MSAPDCTLTVQKALPSPAELAFASDESPNFAPPVTACTLRELEIARIINNPRLRHDINFDANLHFRPRTDGERAQLKQAQIDTYWSELCDELKNLSMADEVMRPERCLRLPRTARLFVEIRTVLGTLVPDRDRQVLEILGDILHIPLLLQQMDKRTLDCTGLARFLARVLKIYCAPMRDAWLDEMVDHIRRGLDTQMIESVVEGIRMLFGFLEAMKLDVANHQIRNLRVLLIEDTVNFEQRYFLRSVSEGRLEARLARHWFDLHQEYYHSLVDLREVPPSDRSVALFVRGLVALIMPSSGCPIPDTFHLDLDRLEGLTMELQEHLTVEVCFEVLEHFVELRPKGEQPRHLEDDFRKAVSSVLDSDMDGSDWSGRPDRLALEIGRHAEKISGRPEVLDKKGVDSIAASVSRALLVQSETWQHLEEMAAEEIWAQTLTHTLYHLRVPITASAEAANVQDAGPEPNSGRLSFPGLSRKLAHLAALHWRVFGPLVYLQPEDNCQDPCT
ncbi:MAG: hypothetical protein M1817_004015 [Caeruleum heppii]|nr:MAG: hypothetical protein M1817_004015 [Caeruleum heppii]